MPRVSFGSNMRERGSIEYTEESLLIEILATDKQDKIIKYEIPITISENCQK